MDIVQKLFMEMKNFLNAIFATKVMDTKMNWKAMLNEIMKKNTTAVISVVKTSLVLESWLIIQSIFMKGQKITNVIFVEKPSLGQEIWRNTSR